jgi:hypothetical protein
MVPIAILYFVLLVSQADKDVHEVSLSMEGKGKADF